jgi:hypothetical protein
LRSRSCARAWLAIRTMLDAARTLERLAEVTTNSTQASCPTPETDDNCAGRTCGEGSRCLLYRCAYAECTAAATDAACELPDHRLGTCCHGVCSDSLDYTRDSRNCGGCGVMCPAGSYCGSGACTAGCCSEDSTCPMCPDGLACGWGSGCVASECNAETEGTVCAGPSGDSSYLRHYCIDGECKCRPDQDCNAPP